MTKRKTPPLPEIVAMKKFLLAVRGLDIEELSRVTEWIGNWTRDQLVQRRSEQWRINKERVEADG